MKPIGQIIIEVGEHEGTVQAQIKSSLDPMQTNYWLDRAKATMLGAELKVAPKVQLPNVDLGRLRGT